MLELPEPARIALVPTRGRLFGDQAVGFFVEVLHGGHDIRALSGFQQRVNRDVLACQAHTMPPKPVVLRTRNRGDEITTPGGPEAVYLS